MRLDTVERPKLKRDYKTRVQDGSLEMIFNDKKVVNRRALRKLMANAPDARISRLKAMGMPYITIAGRDWFDPEAIFVWLKSRERQANPPRKPRRRHGS